MTHLMAIGDYIFSLPTVTYQQLQRRRSWRHAGEARVGARAASQFVGVGDDIITLMGMLAPQIVGDRWAVENLAALADRGAAWPLIDGEGNVYGDFVITDLDDTQRGIMDGGTPRVIDFTVTLKRLDDDAARRAAAPGPQTPVPIASELLGLF